MEPMSRGGGLQPEQRTPLVAAKIACGLVFLIFGFAGFFFSVWRSNWDLAMWCLLLEIGCSLVLQLTQRFHKGDLYIKFGPRLITTFKYIAVVVMLTSLGWAVAYTVLGATNNEEFHVRSNYAPAPVALLSTFWWTVLFFDCRMYEARRP